MNELALFAGSGGGLLASKLLGWSTVCAVEIEQYPRDILMQRQQDGVLDHFPIWDDVRTFDGTPWRGLVDIVSGGFPCQPHSSAARGRNKHDTLWVEMYRIIKEAQPRFVFAENVSRSAIEMAAEDLGSIGYECVATSLSAANLGADHIRERHWLLGDTNRNGQPRRTIDAEMAGMQSTCPRVWKSEPSGIRVAHGVADRVDRIKAIGNGQVPAVAATAFRILSEGVYP